MLAFQPIAERLAFHEWHREPQLTGRFTLIVHRQDVGMLQAGGQHDLALEPLGAEYRRDLWMEQLERDRTVVLEIVGEIDRRYPAAPQLPIEAVVAGKGGTQARIPVGQRGLGVGDVARIDTRVRRS